MDKAEDIDTFKAKLRFRRALARGEPGPERDLEGALDEPWRKKCAYLFLAVAIIFLEYLRVRHRGKSL